MDGENRARFKRDATDKGIVPIDLPQRAANDLPPPRRGDMPMTKAPDRGRLVNPAPVSEAAVHLTKYAKPSLGISPDVLATMDEKIPPAYAARIRDQLRKK
ncbi:MAG: hypothetical protein WBG18_27635 [Xanthobacteraceae bacterium]